MGWVFGPQPVSDAGGNLLSGATHAAAEQFDRAVGLMKRDRKAARETLAAAVALCPGFQLARGLLMALGGPEEPPGEDRETQLCAFLDHVARREYDQAYLIAQRHVIQWPDDEVAMTIFAEFLGRSGAAG